MRVLAVLSVMGGQFYLSWHFAYNDWEVVSGQERLVEIIELLNEEYRPLTEEQDRIARPGNSDIRLHGLSGTVYRTAHNCYCCLL